MLIKKCKNFKNILFLFIFYLSAHGLLLTSKVVMWDGWLWFNIIEQKNYQLLHDLFYQTSLVHIYYIYRFIDLLGNPIVISNILVFVSWFVAGVSVYFILKYFANIEEKNSFFLTLIFLLTPLFIVRFELSMLGYSLTNGLFFLGSYLFLLSTTSTHFFIKFIQQILAFIFLILSFFTASFLVMYGALIFFTFFLFVNKKNIVLDKNYKKIISIIYIFFKKYIFWILLPIIFYIVKNNIIGSPYGIYEGYNSFVFLYKGLSFFKFLFISITHIYQFLFYGILGPLIVSTLILERKIFFIFFLLLLIFIILLDKKINIFSFRVKDIDDEKNNMLPKYSFIWGIILFFFGSLAYILVGESPNLFGGSGFDMRHSLILPIGFSLIIFSSINIFLKKKIHKITKIILVALFIVYNIYNYYGLDMDWYKQNGIIMSIREKYNSGQLGEDHIVVFYDNMPLYNWRGRRIKNHEYTAYLYKATGNSKLIGSNTEDNLDFMLKVKEDSLDFNNTHTAERFKTIRIESSINGVPDVKKWIKLKTAEMFLGKDELNNRIKSLIGVKTDIINNGIIDPYYLTNILNK